MEIKKKVQIRFQTCSNSIRNVNHDFRITMPDYLSDDMWHNKFDNLYFDFQPHLVKEQMKKSYDDYNKKYKEKNKRNLQKGRQSDLLTGVITLSPIMNEWLEKQIIQKEDLDKCFIESMPKVEEKIEEILGEKLQTFSYIIHYDEKTPHLHFAFSNHTNNAESAFHKIKLSGRLNEFQDVVAEVFKNVNLERGDRKSKAKHLSVRRMHEEEIKSLRKEIKDIQALKKSIKSDLDKSKEEKKIELDKLDSNIKSKRNVIDGLQDSIKLRKDRQVENIKELESIISNDVEKIVSSSNNRLELEQVTNEVLKDYARSEFLWSKESSFDSLFEQNHELEDKVSNLEEKINSRTVLSQEKIQELEKEANSLIEEINSKKFEIENLPYYEKKSMEKKSGVFKKKEQFNYNQFLTYSKKREKYLQSLVYQQNDFIKVLMKVLKQIANFYKEALFENEKTVKQNSTRVKQNLNQVFNKTIFESKNLKLTQLNVGKSSLITKKDSNYLDMHQLNLKAQFPNEKDSIKLMMNLRDKLTTFKDVENVSFSQDKESDDSYYINIIAEYKTDLNEVLSKLENSDIEALSKESYIDWSSRDEIDNDSLNILNRQR